MTTEGQAKHPDGAPSARSAHAGSVTLGLIPAPGIPEKIARESATELPGLLGRHIDDRVSWNVPVIVDPLTGTDREAPEILDVCHERVRQEGWDLAVCLTDLPIYRGGYLVVADVSASRKVAGLSLPVLGATRLRPRAREAILQLVDELYARRPELGQDHASADGEKMEAGADAGTSAGVSGLPGQRPHHLIGRRLTKLVAPFQRVEPPDEDMKRTNVDARFAALGALGHLRLLAGMVLANRPWKLFPASRARSPRRSPRLPTCW